MEIYNNYNPFNEIKNFVLSQNPETFLNQTYSVVSKLFLILRKRHDLVFKIMVNSNKSEYDTIASLLTNCFYENIFSSGFIENEFLILMYLSLKKAIDEKQNISSPEDFLKDSINVSLFKCLLQKDDIRSYVGIIIKDVLDKLENECSNKEIICFSIEEIAKIIEESKKSDVKITNTIKRTSPLTVSNSPANPDNDYDGMDLLVSTNIASSFSQIGIRRVRRREIKKDHYKDNFRNITKEELLQKEGTYKENGMKEYVKRQIQMYKEDDTIFQNLKLMSKMTEHGKGETELKYRKNYNIIAELFEKLFTNFQNNIKIIPYSIKCLCKIIANLIEKKYPNISVIERNAYIGEFFFERILKPIFISPDFNGILASVFISPNSRKNIILFQKLLKQLISGNFFNANDDMYYTLFNRFFLTMMPKVLSFFETLIDVKLPGSLENLIYGKIDENNCIYNYFEENPHENIRHWSMCFSIGDILSVYQIINKNENLFIGIKPQEHIENVTLANKIAESQKTFEIIYNKIKENPIYLNTFEKLSKEDKNNRKKTFVLIQKSKFNKKLGKLMKIDSSNQSYTIKLPKEDENSAPAIATEEHKLQLNVMKAKNYLSKILFNFKELTEDILPSTENASIFDLLESIKIFLQTDYYLLLYAIPLDWYSESLISLLRELPTEYSENNYSKLYSELLTEVQQEIEKLSLSPLSEIKTKLKYTKRAQKNVSTYLEKLQQIRLNNKITKFLEVTEYPVTVNIKLKDTNNVFIIQPPVKPKQSLFSVMFSSSTKPSTEPVNKTVFDFILSVPNFVKFHQMENIELTALLTELKVSEEIHKYLKEIKSRTQDYEPLKKFLPQDKDKIYYEIDNIIFSKLYDKLCEKEQDVDDINIYEKCIELSWVTQEQVIRSKQVFLNNNQLTAIIHLRAMEKEKSPLSKLKEIAKIAELIQNTIVFSTGKSENSVDDFIPILVYLVIKARPKMLVSNINYIELFLDPSFKKQSMGHLVSQLSVVIALLKNFSYSNLHNVTEKEYKQ